MVFAELVVQTPMTVAPPRVCVLMAGFIDIYRTLDVLQRSLERPHRSAILLQARWSTTGILPQARSLYRVGEFNMQPFL